MKLTSRGARSREKDSDLDGFDSELLVDSATKRVANTLHLRPVFFQQRLLHSRYEFLQGWRLRNPYVRDAVALLVRLFLNRIQMLVVCKGHPYALAIDLA